MDIGQRQYQEIMSTPTLGSSGGAVVLPSTTLMSMSSPPQDQQQQQQQQQQRTASLQPWLVGSSAPSQVGAATAPTAGNTTELLPNLGSSNNNSNSTNIINNSTNIINNSSLQLSQSQKMQQLLIQHAMNVTAPPPATTMATTNNDREPLPATVATSNNSSPLIKNDGSNGGKGTNNSTPLIHKPTSVKSTPNSTTISSLNNILLKKKPMAFHGKGSFPLNLTLMLESVEREWSFDDDDDDSEIEDGDNEMDSGGGDENGGSVNDDKASSIAPKDKKNGGGKMNHIISWLPCGTGFAIHDTDAFLKEVLPKFFK